MNWFRWAIRFLAVVVGPWLCFSNVALGAIPAAERDALIDFYHSTG